MKNTIFSPAKQRAQMWAMLPPFTYSREENEGFPFSAEIELQLVDLVNEDGPLSVSELLNATINKEGKLEFYLGVLMERKYFFYNSHMNTLYEEKGTGPFKFAFQGKGQVEFDFIGTIEPQEIDFEGYADEDIATFKLVSSEVPSEKEKGAFLVFWMVNGDLLTEKAA